MITVAAQDPESETIARRVYDLMITEQMLRTTTSDIVIDAGGGVLSLQGRVRTNNMHNLAKRLARGGLDGWQLEDRLVSDEAVAQAVAMRLALDPRTTSARVRCEVYLGIVHLKGSVASAAQRAAVIEITRETPGVAGVQDLLSLAP